MTRNYLPYTQDGWIAHLFNSQAARDGGVIRRQARDVERYVGRDAFLAEMRRRGFSVLENAGQFIIICNQEPVRRLL
ncbi:N-(5'-phosphoribosyl)anthranilate isomerase [Paragemmobacter straminiformis]|uniref:N-(5'-phosphoribosyl)anthranilate isomerase n=1 Tax=Paragemmobacter straminiformis TaxID=2045119 RepID=A0A842IC47_9RHOB|nr:N-(5'-phosphoribosyl)anthranilate isomerase [Gemmobacter straminiformis]MBC2837265.1 N-(5'-phosphoribosyl)anthranilate isomerase [Gemmobacter straminiformis]